MNIKARSHAPSFTALRNLRAHALPASGQEPAASPQVGSDRVTLSPEARALTGTVGRGAMGSHIRSDYDDSRRTQGDQALNPATRSSRLADLDQVSQLDNNDHTFDDEDRCGPSSVVAGAYYGGGTQGVRGLVQDMDSYRRRHNLENDPFEGTDVRERLASGNLTRDDLNQVQDGLYATLRDRQDDAVGDLSSVHSGIGDRVLGEFMNQAPNTRRTFDQNNLAIAAVDTQGDGQGNHFVLGGQHQGRAFVYDPYSIQGENGQLNQVTQDPGQIQAYRDAIEGGNNGTQYTYDGGASR